MASHIYVMGVGASSHRVRLLVEAITANSSLEVFVDSSAGGAANYAFFYKAAAVVLVWGDHLTGDIPSAASSEIGHGAGWHPTVVVKIDANVTFPAELAGASIIDLGGWTGGATPELTRLIDQLQHIVSLRLPSSYGETLTPWLVQRAESHVDEIGELVASLRRLDVVLAGDDIPMAEMAATLRELGETYRVVKAAIEQFMAAGLSSQGIDRHVYLRLERGMLAETIHNGRAHCGRIGARYYREGGIRQALESRADGELLSLADNTFARLTNSDMDMLATMDDIGTALTTESRSIVNLLVSGQEAASRQRVSQARDLLLPLEEKLDAAIADFKAIQASLGYAEDRGTEEKGVHMTTIINIGGDNINSNIVVAKIIEDTKITVATPGVPDELRGHLTELTKAVAELSTKLPDDEAEFAASELKVLAEQAASGKPNQFIFQKAVDSLIATATKMAAAGLPIIDLINKVKELVG